MSGVFMDGGGHDSISHGGDGIDHGGHDHTSHGMQHGHGQGGHNFLAQILGLDQQDHAHLAHHGGEGAEGQAPSQTPAWNSALQGLKLENLIAGINITPNFLLFMLFASFVGWLGVIYWIRHHEPFANQVLGSSSAFFPAVGVDRQLINGCRVANPLKTSDQSGVVYCPQPHQDTSPPPAGSPVNAALSAAMLGASQVPPARSPAKAQSYGSTTTYPAMQPSAAAQPPAAGQTYAATQSSSGALSYAAEPQASSPINQGLSAAMAAALGPAPRQAGTAQGGDSTYAQPPAQTYAQPSAQTYAQPSAQAYAPAYSPSYASGTTPAYSAAATPYTIVQQMPAPAAAMAAPMTTGGPMAALDAPAPGGPMPGAGSMRLFSSRRSMMAQAQPMNTQTSPAPMSSPAPAAAAPAVSANIWSLANQGSGTFSADTAQFNSQFGAPLDTAGSDASALSAEGRVSGANRLPTPEGTLKVVTDR